MAVLYVPEQNKTLDSPNEIKSFLASTGVFFDQWQATHELSSDADQDEVLAAYKDQIEPFMAEKDYAVADVININANTPNYDQIRAKFLSEHTHTDDEVRFFVEGEGLFWFNIQNQPVFNVLCQAGDLISVPKNTKHWFDAGKSNPNVKAIRIFVDEAGWVPHYTNSGIQENY